MGGVPTEHSGQTPRQRLKQERKLAALHEVFSFFDTDNDGVLDAAGLEEMLRKRLGPDIPAASLKDLLQQLNPSGASALHFEEFAHGLNQWLVQHGEQLSPVSPLLGLSLAAAEPAVQQSTQAPATETAAMRQLHHPPASNIAAAQHTAQPGAPQNASVQPLQQPEDVAAGHHAAQSAASGGNLGAAHAAQPRQMDDAQAAQPNSGSPAGAAEAGDNGAAEPLGSAGASSADPASARSSPQPGAHRALKARCAELEEELEFSKATILHLLEELRVINASPTDSDSELEGTGCPAGSPALASQASTTAPTSQPCTWSPRQGAQPTAHHASQHASHRGYQQAALRQASGSHAAAQQHLAGTEHSAHRSRPAGSAQSSTDPPTSAPQQAQHVPQPHAQPHAGGSAGPPGEAAAGPHDRQPLRAVQPPQQAQAMSGRLGKLGSGSFTTSKVLTGTAKLVQPGATTTRAAEGLPANTGISEAQQLRVKDRLICELRAQNKQLLDELAGAQKENDKLRAAGRRDMRLQEQHSQLLDKVRGLRHQNEALGAEKAELQRQLDGLKKQVRQHRNQQTMAKEKVNICAQRLQEKGEMLERVHATLKALHTQFAATMQGVSAATVHAHSTAGAAAYKLASVAAAEATLQGLQPEVNTLESQCNMLMQKLALETKARKAAEAKLEEAQHARMPAAGVHALLHIRKNSDSFPAMRPESLPRTGSVGSARRGSVESALVPVRAEPAEPAAIFSADVEHWQKQYETCWKQLNAANAELRRVVRSSEPVQHRLEAALVESEKHMQHASHLQREIAHLQQQVAPLLNPDKQESLEEDVPQEDMENAAAIMADWMDSLLIDPDRTKPLPSGAAAVCQDGVTSPGPQASGLAEEVLLLKQRLAELNEQFGAQSLEVTEVAPIAAA